ncbi:MAG: hypothetical protein EHM45_12395 [Desulfobacteraceae bacterium]|nr:MAG: hypothetical protein EHM45_12395 [Desulfobacteraceae bacterium]
MDKLKNKVAVITGAGLGKTLGCANYAAAIRRDNEWTLEKITQMVPKQLFAESKGFMDPDS